jgi:ubiquinone/menaquinone biosynthesis C-methylase UbiE
VRRFQPNKALYVIEHFGTTESDLPPFLLELQKTHRAPAGYSHEVYESVLTELLDTRCRWLDLGCGHQILPPWREVKELELVAKVPMVVGADYDHPSLIRHLSIHRRVRTDITALPFHNSSFDLVTANMVLEHVVNPDQLLGEVFRVLQPGGLFLAHTPNAHGYGTVLARMVPEFAKPGIIQILHGRPEHDVFPAHYRLNSEHALQRAGKTAGFERVMVRFLASDALLIMIPPLAALELVGIRLLMTHRFRKLRPYILASMEKH